MTPIILKYALFIISQGLFFSTFGRGNWVVYIFTGFLAIVSTAFLASKELYGSFLDVVGIEAPTDPSDCAAQDSEWALAAEENTCYAIRAYLRRHGDSQCYAVELASGRRDGLCQAYDAEQARLETERRRREEQARIEAERRRREEEARLEAERRRLEQERLEAERRRREEQAAAERARQAEERRRREEEAGCQASGVGPCRTNRPQVIQVRPSQAVTEQPSRQPGEVFRDFPAAPEMVVIPGGSFLMGSPANEGDRNSNEGPQTRVTIGSFALGKYEVTFDEYDACADAGACRAVSNDIGWGRGRRPVIEVNIEDAEKYIGWLNSQVDGSPYRLPSEAEWEYAARAGTTTRYPWGGSFSKDQANGSGTGGGDRFRNTSPAGSFPANGFGLHDMIGNVREWTADCWNGSYSGRPTNGSAWRAGYCASNVLRGSSWRHYPDGLRSAYRYSYRREDRLNYVGFRVARTLP